ncbi:MAG: hypothetical protein Q8P46_06990 [Hyphomicrobiales bacterium]|nr:hypothetical protein [Hyphomicrobiales bacterium]
MMALAIVGGLIQAAGALQSAKAQADAANYNAAVNDRNALAARSQGAAEGDRQRRLNQMNLGRLRAAYGDAGLGFEGDVLTVFEDAETQAELDVATVRYQTSVRVAGYKDQAQLDRMEAKSASSAGVLGAFGAIVGAGRSILRAA